jgi:CDP-diacylglycerol--glycerol-3-phosphate 3-phosphatidyltransferase
VSVQIVGRLTPARPAPVSPTQTMHWIPNLLTASRILLLLPLMWLLASASVTSTYLWAFALFLLASISDFFDGWAARRLGCESNLGIFFDPLADKIFANVLLVFLACSYPECIPLWMVLLLLAREFAVQGFRSMAPCVGVVISTGRLNKLKLVLQLVAAGITLAWLGLQDMGWILRPAARIALGLALLSAYVSMYTLFRDNADLWGRTQVEMEKR